VSRFAAFVVTVLLLVPLREAFAAPTTQQCVAAFEEGQKLRANGSLVGARQQFAVCAESSCPELTKGDCGTWLGQVDASIPTFLFVVTDSSGGDVFDVTITVDGQPLVTRLDGKAVPLDPGSHKLRFERTGEPASEVSIVAREGERNRRVDITLGENAVGGGSSGEISPAAWALGAAGLAGIAVFGILGGLGLSEKADADDTCSPTCSDDVVDPIRAKFIGADIALSVGLVALGAGVTIGIVTGLGAGSDSASIRLSPTLGGGRVDLLGHF
jgi:hypothetical protein